MNIAERRLLEASSIWLFALGLLGPLFAVFTDQIGGNILEISGIYSLFILTTGIANILFGKLSDKYNKANLVIIGHVLCGVTMIGYIFVVSIIHLLIVQVLFGLASSLANPAWSALYDQFSGEDQESGFAWGLASGIGNIVTAIATFLGGLIVVKFSFDLLFGIMSFIFFLSALPIIKMKKFLS